MWSLCALLGPALTAAPVVVQPVESDAVFANPHQGWQTFHRTAAADPALAGLPSASAYYRFYWRDLEPVAGQIDFARLDALLEQCRAAGQQLAWRLMCLGTDRRPCDTPDWLRAKCPGTEFQLGDDGITRWAPDLDSPVFQEAHARTVRALAARYDGHPDLDLLDIGTVGLWGEWHMSGTGVKMPSLATRQAIVDLWRGSFPRTATVMLIGDLDPLRHALAGGAGWRADCLGDLGGFSPTWNHMQHFYRQQLEKAGGNEAWKQAPVAFESCWDMRKWVAEGWPLRTIFDYALDLHASYLNNKSAPLPEGSRPEVERFLRKLGYRLVLRRLTHPATAPAGSTLEAVTAWDNVGVAPPYHDYHLAFRLQQAAGGPPLLLTDPTTLRGRLPGSWTQTSRLSLPADLPPGDSQLALAFVRPGETTPALRLAIEGRGEDGWSALSRVTVMAR
ncbi:MAG: DUF4832 domain-containing protein [Fimbriimonadaceae bacterium]|nr:DUF4832 domain-containing protein [Fimbriimonadaceae bacterium]